MNEVALLQAWLGGAVLGARWFLTRLPASNEWFEADKWLRSAATLWWLFQFLFPFVDLTAQSVGWPCCLIDEALIAWCFVLSVRSLQDTIRQERAWRTKHAQMDS